MNMCMDDWQKLKESLQVRRALIPRSLILCSYLLYIDLADIWWSICLKYSFRMQSWAPWTDSSTFDLNITCATLSVMSLFDTLEPIHTDCLHLVSLIYTCNWFMQTIYPVFLQFMYNTHGIIYIQGTCNSFSSMPTFHCLYKLPFENFVIVMWRSCPVLMSVGLANILWYLVPFLSLPKCLCHLLPF